MENYSNRDEARKRVKHHAQSAPEDSLPDFRYRVVKSFQIRELCLLAIAPAGATIVFAGNWVLKVVTHYHPGTFFPSLLSFALSVALPFLFSLLVLVWTKKSGLQRALDYHWDGEKSIKVTNLDNGDVEILQGNERRFS